MKAALFEQFEAPLKVLEVPAPVPHPDAVIIAVRACGICRSDWHAWMGHDDGVQLPHVPGHELAGVVLQTGAAVRSWKVGDRVTAPFCCGCGVCPECLQGHSQVCDNQTQPGFTHWGAFAEQVEIRHADQNLVALPAQIDFVTAASLGCRFATSFRALVEQARVRAGDWVAVHGCGGVGLSAIMIARALGAQIVAIDVRPDRLQQAKLFGADECIEASSVNVVQRIRQITGRGANVSVDALGHPQTCFNSVACLAKRGRHVQVGLMLADQATPAIPMAAVIANELEIYGSHGMQAHEYPRLLQLILSDRLQPQRLVSDVVGLEQGAEILTKMAEYPGAGITVIEFPE